MDSKRLTAEEFATELYYIATRVFHGNKRIPYKERIGMVAERVKADRAALEQRVGELEERCKEAGEYATRYLGCQCGDGESEPGDCWPCRMLMVCYIVGEKPELTDADKDAQSFLENL